MAIGACSTLNDDELYAPTQMITDPHKASEIVVDHSILGKKLENPYSIRAMRAACEELSPATRGNTAAIDSAIAPNYLYVRMLPEDSLEFNSIMQVRFQSGTTPLPTRMDEGRTLNDNP